MQSLVEIIDGSDENVPADGSNGLIPALMAEILILAEELCVTRDQLHVAFKLAAQGSEVTKCSVGEYEYSNTDIDESLAMHIAFYQKTFNRLSETTNAIPA